MPSQKESGAAFWIDVVVLGILVPFVLLLLRVPDIYSDGVLIATASSKLLGNLCLRQAILKGGVFACLKAGRFEYVVTNP